MNTPKLRTPLYFPRLPSRSLAAFNLSPRELQVAKAILHGLSLNEISSRMGVSKSSVATYCKRIYAKLGVANMQEAASQLRDVLPDKDALENEEEYAPVRIRLSTGVQRFVFGLAISLIAALCLNNIGALVDDWKIGDVLPSLIWMLPLLMSILTMIIKVVSIGRKTSWRQEAVFVVSALVTYVASDVFLRSKYGALAPLLVGNATLKCSISLSLMFTLLTMLGALISTMEHCGKGDIRGLVESSVVAICFCVIAKHFSLAVHLIPGLYLAAALSGLIYLRSCPIVLSRTEYRRASSISSSLCFATVVLGACLTSIIIRGWWFAQTLLVVYVGLLYLFATRVSLVCHKPAFILLCEIAIPATAGCAAWIAVGDILVGSSVIWFWISISGTLAASLYGITRYLKLKQFSGLAIDEKAIIVLEDRGIVFSGAEERVFRLLSRGCSAQEICEQLYISKCTFNTHVGSLYKKVGVHNMTDFNEKIKEELRETSRLLL